MITIGVLVSDLFDSYQRTLLHGLEAFAENEDIRLLTFVGGVIDPHINSYTLDRTVYSKISSSAVDVVLLLSGPLSVLCGKDGLETLIKLLPNIPIISVGVKLEGIPSVFINNKKGINEVIDHLVKYHDRKRIGFIKGPDANIEAYERFESYKEGLQRNGIKYDYKLVAPGSFSPGDGIKALNLILDTRKQKLDAIVCCDDYVAIEVCNKLTERGIKVPEDVSVTGFDDLDRSRSFTPSLTTVRQPIFTIGYLAGERCKSLIEKRETALDILIDTQTIYRESCGCDTSIDFKHKPEINIETTFEKQVRNTEECLSRGLKLNENEDGIETHLAPFVKRIANALLKSEKERDVSYIQDEIENVLRETYKQHLKGSYWESILKEFFNSFKVLKLKREDEYFLSSMINSALLKLLEVEKRLTDFKQIDDRMILEYINRSGNQLLFSKSEDELKQILKENLSILRIKSCFIILNNPGSSKGEIFFYRNSDNLVENKELCFDISEVIPKDIGSKCTCSYVVYPLIIDNTPKGYILIESSGTPAIIHDFLVEKVAFGFKNIEMLNQINSYTEMLERAVEERTKELRVANERLKERSMKDQLTGLKNRRFLDDVIIPKSEKLTKKFSNHIVYGKRQLNSSENVSFGIILVDLDHFKMVNDIYGHASGDMVIKELARIFAYSIRQEDYIVRLGGEEFLLVLRDFNGKYIDFMVEKVRKAVEEASFKMENGEIISKTCSLGAIVFPPSLEEPELLDFHSAISIIDKCLYIAKEDGRNRGVVINFHTDKLKNVKDIGEYILNNFEKCLASGEISVRDSKEKQ